MVTDGEQAASFRCRHWRATALGALGAVSQLGGLPHFSAPVTLVRVCRVRPKRGCDFF